MCIVMIVFGLYATRVEQTSSRMKGGCA
jgi:hypothetical protein